MMPSARLTAAAAVQRFAACRQPVNNIIWSNLNKFLHRFYLRMFCFLWMFFKSKPSVEFCWPWKLETQKVDGWPKCFLKAVCHRCDGYKFAWTYSDGQSVCCFISLLATNYCIGISSSAMRLVLRLRSDSSQIAFFDSRGHLYSIYNKLVLSYFSLPDCVLFLRFR